MEISLHSRPARGMHNDFGARRGRNKQWVAPGAEQPSRSASTTPGHSDAERRDGGRGRGRGRGNGHAPRTNGIHLETTSRTNTPPVPLTESTPVFDDPVLETQEEREKFWQELVKQRETERKTAIAEGKMDDPNVPKRLEDAISIVGTCMDMCPRFERYRRERENNLFDWEKIPGTNRVDHPRAVKMYERAAGDKTLPSDLRPPHVLKRTLDYLFHDLIPRGGFSPTCPFVRDRSRAVRNDFTMQHDTGPLAMECHERCARFHILALFLERDKEGFSVALEEQQLMNTLQSLKEFYNDQRGTYQSPAELEMRIYHRLIHIRDQVERPEPVPLSQDVAEHPMYKLTTAFRAHVQEKSKPITKTSRLRVDAEGMRIFGELAGEMMMMGDGGGGKGMVYLVACILERLFGKGTVEDIEEIRGGASLGDIIDGLTGQSAAVEEPQAHVEEVEVDELDDEMTDQDDIDIGEVDDLGDGDQAMQSPAPLKSSASGWLAENFGATPGASVFGPPSSTAPAPASAFASLGATAPKSVFAANSALTRKSVFANTGPSPFGPIPNTVTTNSSALTNQNGPATLEVNPFRPPVKPSQPEVSSSSSSADTTSTSNVFTVPPRVQNNPLASNMANSPFAPPTSSPPPTNQAPTSNNNILAPTPKPASVGFTDKGKSKASELFSWTGSAPPTSTLNAKAPEFTPSPSTVFQPQAAAKPVFGVTPIPFFNGVPTSVSTSSSSPLPAVNIPPAPKPAPPPLAKIDTTPPVGGTEGAAGPSSPITPGNPPPLAKVQPISLPSTPTLAPAVPAAFSVAAGPSSPMNEPRPTKAANPLVGFLKNSLQTSNLGGNPGGSGMLSPLVLASPSSTPLRHSFSPVKQQTQTSTSAPALTAAERAPSPVHINGDIKGKGKARAVEPVEGNLEAMALAFEQRGVVVRRCLALWQKRTTDRAEWAEACRQSEKYSEKVRRAREKEKGVLKRPSPNGKKAENGSKRMRLVGNGEDGDMEILDVSAAKRRTSLRRRKYEAPRTDEDLAKRFQENKEEHARRWAQGSFLQVVRTLLKSKSKSTKSPSSALWRIWLSLNPESDATAIWLECKFDVPGSGGQWETETVFSIPVMSKPPPHNPDSAAEGYPGVIVFECTPLAGVKDELERKYRILDDCSRLRDIIKALPEKRHFVPSLLLFVWAADEPVSPADVVPLPGDFLDMVNKMVADSVIASFRAFCVTATTTDLDRKFGEAVNLLQLDVEGRLVQSLTLRDIFKLFDSVFNSFISEWTESCASSGHFDWTLYCRVIDAAIAILNKTAFLSMSLVGVESDEHVLPAFRPDWNGVRDSESNFDAVGSWLAHPQLDTLAAGIVAADLQSHREIGRDFPTSAFVDHLRGLALYQAETGLNKAQTFFVRTKDVESALETHDAEVQLRRSALSQAQRMSMRRSPRRRSRSLSEETELTSLSSFKRRRISSSNFETSNQPSPSSSPPTSERTDDAVPNRADEAMSRSLSARCLHRTIFSLPPIPSPVLLASSASPTENTLSVKKIRLHTLVQFLMSLVSGYSRNSLGTIRTDFGNGSFRPEKQGLGGGKPDQIFSEHLNGLFPPLKFPSELSARVLTHASHPAAFYGHNAQFAFIGRRVLESYLLLLLASSPHLKPSHDLQEIVSRVLNTYFLGEHIGSKWGLGRVMRWTPTIAASMLLDEARADKTKLLKDVGLYKVQGDAANAVMGAIFQQFGASVAHRVFHTRVLPRLLLPHGGLPTCFHQDAHDACARLGGAHGSLILDSDAAGQPLALQEQKPEALSPPTPNRQTLQQ
ncbi:Nuclear export factor [Mycena venus]|uniref:Nuclear export factor n=1 Tax=Mycena venus TaxID=2733690 RepID=A0A8H6U134_9AGAR|nr:Nuclear export factor [Mycena venus]